MAFKDLKTTTIREFDGGLNVVNDDLNMDKKYSTIETNVFNKSTTPYSSFVSIAV